VGVPFFMYRSVPCSCVDYYHCNDDCCEEWATPCLILSFLRLCSILSLSHGCALRSAVMLLFISAF
jgi:hypothetical protein